MQKRKEEILKEFTGNGLLLTSHGFEKLVDKRLDVQKVIRTAKEKKQWLVSNEFLTEFIEDGKEAAEEIKQPEKEETKTTETVTVERSKRIYAKEVENRLEIIKDTDVTDKSTCEGKIEDFVSHFNDKYAGLQHIIKDRENFLGAVPIEVLKKYKGETSHIIAMVREKRESKKGYRFLEVEDPSGEINVLIPRDNDALNRLYESILADEVIGIQGKLNNDLFIASDIVEPELPVNHRPNYSDEPVHAALISDIHVGSNLFLEKEFNRFLDWLNLKGSNGEIAEKIKYIIVAGDLVDGIGIYPNQEKELTIPDIYKQYDYLATLLEKVPDHIEVVLAMGNHDAVRNAEPQPGISKEIGGKLYDLPNVHITGNPVTVSVHGVKTLVYHGTSMDTLIGNLSNCTYTKPETAMIELLKKRHLIPMYGNDSLSPDKKDYLTIKQTPDIFHAGHVHTNGYGNYRGVKIINSGTWQGRTKYQEELGHIPTPARVPVINLQTHEVSVVHFGEQ